jgi:hypothetical protein
VNVEEFIAAIIQGGSNMTGTNCDLFTHNQSRSYLNHLVLEEEEDDASLVYRVNEGTAGILKKIKMEDIAAV